MMSHALNWFHLTKDVNPAESKKHQPPVLLPPCWKQSSQVQGHITRYLSLIARWHRAGKQSIGSPDGVGQRTILPVAQHFSSSNHQICDVTVRIIDKPGNDIKKDSVLNRPGACFRFLSALKQLVVGLPSYYKMTEPCNRWSMMFFCFGGTIDMSRL